MADNLLTRLFRRDSTIKTTERTGQQIPPNSAAGGLAILQNQDGDLPKPSPGTYKTYREMRSNPTVALARVMARAPIQSANWSVEADEADKEIADFIDEEFTRLWAELLDDMLYAFDYGFAPFEKVYEVGSDGKIHYRKIKPLLVDKTQILVTEKTGEFAGLKQSKGNVVLTPEYCFLYTYDGEAGNLYGRSRHENIRETAWHSWQEQAKRYSKYGKKVAGATPIIEYPEGTGLDANGQEVSNFKLAQAILQNLSAVNGVAMPNTLAKYVEDLARLGGAGKDSMKAWNISFLEAKAAHGKDFVDGLSYWDKLMMRGWLQPERAALEGQHGTKAESETQSQWSYLVGQMLTEEIFRHINQGLVEPLVAINYGPDKARDVKIVLAGIDPLLLLFMRDLVKSLYGNPVNIDLALEAIDMQQVIERVGLPVEEREDEVTVVRNRPMEPGEEVDEGN